MLLGTLGTSLFWNLLTGKGIYRAGKGKGISRACTKIKKEFKNLKKQEILAIFTKMNLIKLVLNIIWLMEISKT